MNQEGKWNIDNNLELRLMQAELHDMHRRERTLVFRLNLKDKKIKDLEHSIFNLQANQEPFQINTLMSDPIINKEFNIMKTLINEKDAKIQELQDKIKASQFNPSKLVGQKLIQKLKKCQEENEELGKQNKEELIQNYKTENSMLKQEVNELLFDLKDKQETNGELHKEIKDIENTFEALHTNIAETKERNIKLQKEIDALKKK